MSICKDCKKKEEQSQDFILEIKSFIVFFEDSLPSAPDDLTFTEFVRLISDNLKDLKEIISKSR